MLFRSHDAAILPRSGVLYSADPPPGSCSSGGGVVTTTEGPRAGIIFRGSKMSTEVSNYFWGSEKSDIFCPSVMI